MAESNVLDALFGSRVRLRLLRLFLLNPDEIFDLKTISSRVRGSANAVRKELVSLSRIGYIRRATKVSSITLKNSRRILKKRIQGYSLLREFPYINELAALLASNAPYAREVLLKGIRNSGKINMLIIAGTLLHQKRDYVDVFIVGDSLKKSKLEKLLKIVEAEIGKELVYAIMATKEFQYRYGMQDRFIKTLFDNPHELLINKLGIG